MTGQTKAPDRLWLIVLPGRRDIPSPFRLRIARSSLRQTGGSSGCFHGFPSSIDGVLRPETAMSSPVNGNMLTAPPSADARRAGQWSL